MKTRILPWIVCLALCLSLAACGTSDTANSQTPVNAGDTAGDGAEGQEGSNGQTDFPQSNIKIIVPYSAGGGTDLAARLYADELTRILGVSVVVDNKAGGSGVIGTTEVITSKADGYTLLYTQFGPVIVQTALGVTEYDYSDILPVAGAVSAPCTMIVRADSEWESYEDMIAYAQANPGQLQYGIPGTVTYAHLVAEDFSEKAGVQLTSVVFDGTAPAVAALLGDHVNAVAAPFNDIKAYLDSGECRILYSTQQTDLTGEVTVLADKGVDVDTLTWSAFFVPQGTPDEVVAVLEDAIRQAAESDTLREQLANLGVEPTFAGQSDLIAILDHEKELNTEILERIGMTQ